MIKILQKSCFREEVRFQGERRSIRQRSGDSLDGPINLQARNTVPKLPEPSTERIRYLPNRITSSMQNPLLS